jgi:multiple sugar transport system permease protein
VAAGFLTGQARRRAGLASAAATLLTLVVSFPVLWMLVLSVKPAALMFNLPPVWLFPPTLEHYAYVLVEKGLWIAVVNSVLISFASTALVVLIGTPAAYALARFEIPRRDDLLLFVLATRMAPPIGLAVPFYLLFGRLHLLNSFGGLVLAYLTFNLSLYVWIVRSFCREIPYELEEAAFTEGYSRWQVFVRVALPLLRPGIIATSVLCLIFAWNEFLYAFILGGRDVRTLPVAIPGLITTRGVEWGALAALGLIAVVPVFVVVALLQRHIVRGLTMGAVKG